MRTRWLSILLGSVFGLTLVATTTSEIYAQKQHSGGGNSGGHYGGYGGHGGYGGYGGWGVGVYAGPGYYNHGYGYSYPYYSNYNSGYGYPSYSYAYPSYDSTYSQPDYTSSTEYQSNYYSPSQQQAKGPVKTVLIDDSVFSPVQLDIKVGTTVRWINNSHDMRSLAQPSRDWKSQNLANGQAYTWTFQETGTYTFQDASNPNMKMTVIVR